MAQQPEPKHDGREKSSPKKFCRAHASGRVCKPGGTLTGCTRVAGKGKGKGKGKSLPLFGYAITASPSCGIMTHPPRGAIRAERDISLARVRAYIIMYADPKTGQKNRPWPRAASPLSISHTGLRPLPGAPFSGKKRALFRGA